MKDTIRVHPSADPRSFLIGNVFNEWPPPETIVVIDTGRDVMVREGDPGEEGVLHRVAYSKLPPREPHMVRGALYVEDPEQWDGST